MSFLDADGGACEAGVAVCSSDSSVMVFLVLISQCHALLSHGPKLVMLMVEHAALAVQCVALSPQWLLLVLLIVGFVVLWFVALISQWMMVVVV